MYRNNLIRGLPLITDKKDTWVTLRYVEKWIDKTGKRDSLYYADDVLLKDGKIKLYDEKTRHFPASTDKK